MDPNSLTVDRPAQEMRTALAGAVSVARLFERLSLADIRPLREVCGRAQGRCDSPAEAAYATMRRWRGGRAGDRVMVWPPRRAATTAPTAEERPARPTAA
jgi:hypothetical protein